MNAPRNYLLDPIKVEIPAAAWKPSGHLDDQRARLLATLEINGQHFHAEAYQVRTSKDGVQTIADPNFDPEWQGICALQNDGGAFTTQRIKGREYVIVVSPFLD